jgi:hypothetical protein
MSPESKQQTRQTQAFQDKTRQDKRKHFQDNDKTPGTTALSTQYVRGNAPAVTQDSPTTTVPLAQHVRGKAHVKPTVTTVHCQFYRIPTNKYRSTTTPQRQHNAAEATQRRRGNTTPQRQYNAAEATQRRRGNTTPQRQHNATQCQSCHLPSRRASCHRSNASGQIQSAQCIH